MLNANFALAQYSLNPATKTRAYEAIAALVPMVKAEGPKPEVARAA